jgi:hypothetical protein
LRQPPVARRCAGSISVESEQGQELASVGVEQRNDSLNGRQPVSVRIVGKFALTFAAKTACESGVLTASPRS